MNASGLTSRLLVPALFLLSTDVCAQRHASPLVLSVRRPLVLIGASASVARAFLLGELRASTPGGRSWRLDAATGSVTTVGLDCELVIGREWGVGLSLGYEEFSAQQSRPLTGALEWTPSGEVRACYDATETVEIGLRLAGACARFRQTLGRLGGVDVDGDLGIGLFAPVGGSQRVSWRAGSELVNEHCAASQQQGRMLTVSETPLSGVCGCRPTASFGLACAVGVGADWELRARVGAQAPFGSVGESWRYSTVSVAVEISRCVYTGDRVE